MRWNAQAPSLSQHVRRHLSHLAVGFHFNGCSPRVFIVGHEDQAYKDREMRELSCISKKDCSVKFMGVSNGYIIVERAGLSSG